MDTSLPSKEVEKVDAPETKAQDEENKQNSPPTDPSNDSNAEKGITADLHAKNVETESVDKSNVAKEESTPISNEAQKVDLVAVDNVPDHKDEPVARDSVQTEVQITASADSQTTNNQSGSVQLATASESEPSQPKADELMETADVQAPTEVPVKDVAMEDAQSATVAAESVSQSDANIEVIDISEASPETQTQKDPVGSAIRSGQHTGLALLAEMYDSGNDSDVCEVPSMTKYQNRIVEIDSDTESSSSSSDDEQDNEAIDVDLINAAQADDDDEEGGRNTRPKVKGEFHLEDLPPIHELHITVPEEECTELGKVQSIVEQLVLVNSLPGTVPLDLDTVLFLEKGKKVLGEVFDVLGQVSDPLYCVRFNSNKDILAKGIEVGQMVYVAPRTQHTQFVILANLMKDRGSDASWEYDLEPPERYLEYSDDEEERNARRTIRNRHRPMEAIDEGPKRSRHADGPSPSGSRSHRDHHYDGPRSSHHPNNYRLAGNSWHSNYPQSYSRHEQHSQHSQHSHHRQPPMHYRESARNAPHRSSGSHSGMVVNPYAMYPPPHSMQQPLFPPQTHQPPPPGPRGGY